MSVLPDIFTLISEPQMNNSFLENKNFSSDQHNLNWPKLLARTGSVTGIYLNIAAKNT